MITPGTGFVAKFRNKDEDGKWRHHHSPVVVWVQDDGEVYGLIASERAGGKLRRADSFSNFNGYASTEEFYQFHPAPPGWWGVATSDGDRWWYAPIIAWVWNSVDMKGSALISSRYDDGTDLLIASDTNSFVYDPTRTQAGYGPDPNAEPEAEGS